jgi:uncharacterized membrane protein YfcA
MTALLVEIVLGLAIGVTMGLLGGGGSILTVPALVYIVGQTPSMAVTTSLMIVGANSAMGMLFHSRHGVVNARIALMFGGAGMIVAYLAAGLSRALPPVLLMLAFGIIMLLFGVIMVRGGRVQASAQAAPSTWAVLLTGAGIGLMTGLLGVGGGFMIVPALVLLLGVPMREAVGTSLIIIAMNSVAGFLGHLDGLTLDYGLIAVFAISGLVGTFAGARLAGWLAPDILRRLFGAFIIMLGAALLLDNLLRALA